MMSRAVTLVLLLCLVGTTVGFLHKGHRRFRKRLGGSESEEEPKSKLFFKLGTAKGKTLEAGLHQSVVLECEVGGSPSPTIHWLKDGKRVPQGYYHSYKDDEADNEDSKGPNGEPLSRLATTHARLFLDCLTEKDEGVYTCVAETPYTRITQDTNLKIGYVDYEVSASKECNTKTAERLEPARITQWTVSRLEFEGAKVQLLCRAEGVPAPTISWTDRDGHKIPSDSPYYRITKNGDLIIREASWLDNMGTYTCEAENVAGKEQQRTFFYPMSRDK